MPSFETGVVLLLTMLVVGIFILGYLGDQVITGLNRLIGIGNEVERRLTQVDDTLSFIEKGVDNIYHEMVFDHTSSE